jgi:hypothetical protein
VWFLRREFKIQRMKSVIITGTIILICIFDYSCKKIEKLPVTPEITFTSFKVFDTTDILGNQGRAGRLKFYFVDGDGDLGLDPPTTEGQDSTNLFLKLYRVTNGVLVPAADNDILKPSDYRIPYLQTIGQNNALKGTISVTFLYLFYSPADTIKYEFYIKDRALHVSNTLTTCEIPLVVDTICKGN